MERTLGTTGFQTMTSKGIKAGRRTQPKSIQPTDSHLVAGTFEPGAKARSLCGLDVIVLEPGVAQLHCQRCRDLETAS